MIKEIFYLLSLILDTNQRNLNARRYLNFIENLEKGITLHRSFLWMRAFKCKVQKT